MTDRPMTLRTRTAVVVALAVIFNATGNLFLSLGMKRVGEVRDWSARTPEPLC